MTDRIDFGGVCSASNENQSILAFAALSYILGHRMKPIRFHPEAEAELTESIHYSGGAWNCFHYDAGIEVPPGLGSEDIAGVGFILDGLPQ